MYNVDKIFDLLKQRKLRQLDLAQAINVSQGNIADWKRGKAKPSVDVSQKIADYFKLPLSEFYVYDSDVSTPPDKEEINGKKIDKDYIKNFTGLDFSDSNVLYIMGKNGVNMKIPIPPEKLERFKKLLEAGMPELLDDYSDL